MDDSPVGEKRHVDEPDDLQPDSSIKRQKSRINVNNNNNPFLPSDDQRTQFFSPNSNFNAAISIQGHNHGWTSSSTKKTLQELRNRFNTLYSVKLISSNSTASSKPSNTILINSDSEEAQEFADVATPPDTITPIPPAIPVHTPSADHSGPHHPLERFTGNDQTDDLSFDALFFAQNDLLENLSAGMIESSLDPSTITFNIVNEISHSPADLIDQVTLVAEGSVVTSDQPHQGTLTPSETQVQEEQNEISEPPMEIEAPLDDLMDTLASSTEGLLAQLQQDADPSEAPMQPQPESRTESNAIQVQQDGTSQGVASEHVDPNTVMDTKPTEPLPAEEPQREAEPQPDGKSQEAASEPIDNTFMDTNPDNALQGADVAISSIAKVMSENAKPDEFIEKPSQLAGESQDITDVPSESPQQQAEVTEMMTSVESTQQEPTLAASPNIETQPIIDAEIPEAASEPQGVDENTAVVKSSSSGEQATSEAVDSTPTTLIDTMPEDAMKLQEASDTNTIATSPASPEQEPAQVDSIPTEADGESQEVVNVAKPSEQASQNASEDVEPELINTMPTERAPESVIADIAKALESLAQEPLIVPTVEDKLFVTTEDLPEDAPPTHEDPSQDELIRTPQHQCTTPTSPPSRAEEIPASLPDTQECIEPPQEEMPDAPPVEPPAAEKDVVSVSPSLEESTTLQNNIEDTPVPASPAPEEYSPVSDEESMEVENTVSSDTYQLKYEAENRLYGTLRLSVCQENIAWDYHGTSLEIKYTIGSFPFVTKAHLLFDVINTPELESLHGELVMKNLYLVCGYSVQFNLCLIPASKDSGLEFHGYLIQRGSTPSKLFISQFKSNARELLESSQLPLIIEASVLFMIKEVDGHPTDATAIAGDKAIYADTGLQHLLEQLIQNFEIFLFSDDLLEEECEAVIAALLQKLSSTSLNIAFNACNNTKLTVHNHDNDTPNQHSTPKLHVVGKTEQEPLFYKHKIRRVELLSSHYHPSLFVVVAEKPSLWGEWSKQVVKVPRYDPLNEATALDLLSKTLPEIHNKFFAGLSYNNDTANTRIMAVGDIIAQEDVTTIK